MAFNAGAATPVAGGSMPTARWEGPGVVLEVGMNSGMGVSAESTDPALLYLAGAAGAVVAIVDPVVALAVPFVIVLGPPLQASFNADIESLVKVLASTPVPERVVDALRSQWPLASPFAGPSLQVRMRIFGYGLVTRSGRQLAAFEAKEELCLVADAQLELERTGTQARVEKLSIGLAAPSADAPPPLCNSLARLSASDGRLLRQSVGELAEVLAAMVLNRIELAK